MWVWSSQALLADPSVTLGYPSMPYEPFLRRLGLGRDRLVYCGTDATTAARCDRRFDEEPHFALVRPIELSTMLSAVSSQAGFRKQIFLNPLMEKCE